MELISFTGSVDGRGMAMLRWSTATERNTAYFALERSADNSTFTEVGRVAAAGTSTQPLTYQWPDPQRLVARMYYRLRQADRDGVVHYSSVVALAPAPRLARQAEVYPVPSAGQPIQLLLESYDEEAVTLRLSDALGRVLLTTSLAPSDAHYLAPLPCRWAWPKARMSSRCSAAASPFKSESSYLIDWLLFTEQKYPGLRALPGQLLRLLLPSSECPSRRKGIFYALGLSSSLRPRSQW
ncbi:hypothetical protein ACFQT0_25615 [Hymenobacter humi]|uniref:Uncharacterized protein n=1 Tax=Hymenobacter humi TaxID=1411620 RepID=A0ABW2UA40_9BACT